MIKVIGVRFRKAGRIYSFDPAALDIKKGDHVIVETARGVEYGYVVFGVKEEKEENVVMPLKTVKYTRPDGNFRFRQGRDAY